jgi:hypothetical protein
MDLGPPTLTPADVAAGFARVFVVLLGILLLASVIRRAAKGVVLKSAAYVLLIPAALFWLTLAISLAYPHHHHDTEWLGAGADPWNYLVDLAVGVSAIFAYIIFHRFIWRRWAQSGTTDSRSERSAV